MTIPELVSKGEYLAALRLLRESTEARGSDGLEQQALHSELLERTGDGDRATELARRVLRSEAASPSLRARCHGVIGRVLRDCGRTSEAIEQFQRAAALAVTARDTEQLCWVQLPLMLALAEGPGPDAAITFLPTVRRAVSRAGKPAVSSALHLFVAQIEAKRGLLSAAREHVRIGRSLLHGQENCWLDGTAAVDASCLAFLASDLKSASIEAELALELASRSGHAAVRRAALANLGHLELAAGRLRGAEDCLTQALGLSNGLGDSRTGVIDGLAQVSIMRREYQRAEELLASTRPWTPRSPRGTWYYGLWTLLTRCKLLLCQGRPQEALESLSQATTPAADQPDTTLATSLRLLRAEALVRTGQHEEAAAVIAEAVGGSDGPASIEMLAEAGRVSGHALAAAHPRDCGSAAFERAARILATVGNRSGRVDLLEHYAAALWGRLSPAAPFPRPPRQDELPPPPARVTVRLDATTSLATPAGPPPATAVSRAATILDAGGYPEVMAHEVVELLRETAAVPAGALACTWQGRTDVLSWWGCPWPEAVALAAAPPRRIDLGDWHGRTFALAIRPPRDASRWLALLAVEAIARSARWQDKARRDERERAALWPIEPGNEAGDAIFLSEAMNEIVTSARKVAPVPITVLLTGETGTGKEVVARIVHAASARADRPFVPFNCTAVPREMIDSQLFGYRRGAFTGAVADFPGVIRAASGGTLFLDEIGELGLDVQPKLLRFLESGEVHPLGDAKPAKVDVRVIASTNANLEQLVAEGRFREDLFYRLNVIRFPLPPLRERREEIPPLAEHFLQRAAREFHKSDLRLAEESTEYLVLYRWPGNVRQLANEMRRLAALAENGGVLMPEHLDPAITAGRRTVPVSQRGAAANEVVVRLDQPLPAAVEHLERTLVQHVLRATGGRMEEAARLLGLSRKGLYLKRQRLNIGID